MCKYKNLHTGEKLLEKMSFFQNLLNFIITKYLKQEINDELSICMDQHTSCGLSMTGDI